MDNDLAFWIALVIFLVSYLICRVLIDLVLKGASNLGIIKLGKNYNISDAGFYSFYDSGYSSHDSSGSNIDCNLNRIDFSGDFGSGCDGGT
ncbi:MAG: hypothetical protein Kow0049_00240 [Stanieria sp.]